MNAERLPHWVQHLQPGAVWWWSLVAFGICVEVLIVVIIILSIVSYYS